MRTHAPLTILIPLALLALSCGTDHNRSTAPESAPETGAVALKLAIPQALDIDRDDFILGLNDLNISAIVHYIPLHLFTHYKRTCGVREGDFPNAESAYSRVVSLPLWPGMDEQDTEDVVAAVTWLVKKHARRRAS